MEEVILEPRSAQGALVVEPAQVGLGLGYAWDLALELTKKEIKSRYKSNVLGYLWSVLNPLAQAVTFYVAFKVVFRAEIPGYTNYSLFLITGLFPWQWFSNSVQASSRVYISNASLIRKLAFRREVLPLSTVLNDLIHFLLSIPVIVIFLWCAGSGPSWSWLYGLPCLVFAQLLFVYGLSLVTASVNVFFRDLDNVVSIVIQMWFYFTPIVWHPEMLPKDSAVHIVLNLNPLASLMVAYRELFVHGVFDAQYFLWSVISGAITLGIGFFIHGRLKWRFAETL